MSHCKLNPIEVKILLLQIALFLAMTKKKQKIATESGTEKPYEM
jgi:hypothetical protein